MTVPLLPYACPVPPCPRCGGDGYDPEQPPPTEQEMACGPSPIVCTDCHGSGLLTPLALD